ncbi:hypothetical protein [Nocardia abscessus]|uniref:hypothetical protein n=1 Tax=Nocardia abscessus TaxID=120957 RepID=UPI0024552D34|nr:hypothetical protein [Nocardia abscessus]
MSECEKCIRAQDERDPFGAAGRARMRALYRALAPNLPQWDLPDDEPRQTCIDCPACGGHWMVDEGDEWCWNCRWQLAQVENHVGPPVDSGFRIGELVKARTMMSPGKVHHLYPNGEVEVWSGGWTFRCKAEDLSRIGEQPADAADSSSSD